MGILKIFLLFFTLFFIKSEQTGEKVEKMKKMRDEFKNLLFILAIIINLMEFISDFQYDESWEMASEALYGFGKKAVATNPKTLTEGELSGSLVSSKIKWCRKTDPPPGYWHFLPPWFFRFRYQKVQ